MHLCAIVPMTNEMQYVTWPCQFYLLQPFPESESAVVVKMTEKECPGRGLKVSVCNL